MKAELIQVGKYYWIAGMGPMLCTEVPDKENPTSYSVYGTPQNAAGKTLKTTVTFKALPLDANKEPWENYWADPKDVLYESSEQGIAEFRANRLERLVVD